MICGVERGMDDPLHTYMSRSQLELIQLNFYVTAGEVSGPKMRGRLRTVGGDWLLLRPDGVGLLDVRATMELESWTTGL
jgi:Protein of unknown function (DUF3237)